MNVKLFQKVKKAIVANPEKLKMRAWVTGTTVYDEKTKSTKKVTDLNVCGTAACISGWAAWIADPDKWPHNASNGDKYLGIEDQRIFYVESWPRRYRKQYMEARNQKKRANIVRNVINSYIRTNGWPTKW
jgi:hypothetical protein